MKSIKYVFIVVVSLVLTCGLILVGCQLLDQDDSVPPTAPGVANGVLNYWGQTGREGGKFTIFVPENRRNFFSVNVPENDRQKTNERQKLAEGYSLWYRIYRSADKKFHAYVLYFKALEEATLCIGLLDGPPYLDEGEFDVLEHVEISYEYYDPEALVHTQGPLEMYAFPGEWVHWDQPEGGARVPAPDDPPEDKVLYAFSEGKTDNTMENRCGFSETPDPAPVPSCPPPYTGGDFDYIQICDDTADGSGPKVTEEAGCGSLLVETFTTAPGNRGVQVSVDSPSTWLNCFEWTTQFGSWQSTGPILVDDGESHTLEGPYNVALECTCDAA